jgi:hypothetical protein
MINQGASLQTPRDHRSRASKPVCHQIDLLPLEDRQVELPTSPRWLSESHSRGSFYQNVTIEVAASGGFRLSRLPLGTSASLAGHSPETKRKIASFEAHTQCASEGSDGLSMAAESRIRDVTTFSHRLSTVCEKWRIAVRIFRFVQMSVWPISSTLEASRFDSLRRFEVF